MFALRKTALLLMAALLVGCTPPTGLSITGSGAIVTQEEDITGFDSVEASNAFTVNISRGEGFRVVVQIDDNLVRYLRVAREGGTLKLGLEPGRAYSLRNATLQANVTMPALASLDLSGASRASITGFASASRLNVSLSGASALSGDIEAGDATFNASGASNIVLKGSAQNVRIDASGASQIDLGAFPAGDANIDASGGSRVAVNLSGRLDVQASGASNVRYTGSPTLGRIDTSGASSVQAQ